jgi:hypothetical protein
MVGDYEVKISGFEKCKIFRGGSGRGYEVSLAFQNQLSQGETGRFIIHAEDKIGSRGIARHRQ